MRCNVGSVGVVGNNICIGLTNGTDTRSLQTYISSQSTLAYGKGAGQAVGTTATTGGFPSQYVNLGLSKDKTTSGIITEPITLSISNKKLGYYMIKYL